MNRRYASRGNTTPPKLDRRALSKLAPAVVVVGLGLEIVELLDSLVVVAVIISLVELALVVTGAGVSDEADEVVEDVSEVELMLTGIGTGIF